MELTNVTTMNRLMAAVAAALFDAGFPTEAERVLYWVGHQDVNGRPRVEFVACLAHLGDIMRDPMFCADDGVPFMAEDLARALAGWADTWGSVPQHVEAIAGALRVVEG